MKLSIIEHRDLGCIRTQLIKGEPWFVAKDVCEVLGIEKHRDAVARLDDEDKRESVVVDTLGGKQKMTAINESGLYNLIFMSRKPAAIKFKRWVTSEVLPSLRKYGKYVVRGSVEETKERQKLDKKERLDMLREIDCHLTSTDRRIMAKKCFVDEWDIRRVLDGSKEDATILIECIERATRNANVKRKLNNSAVRKQIIAILHGENVRVLGGSKLIEFRD